VTDYLSVFRTLLSPILVIVFGMVVLLMDLGTPSRERRQRVWGFSLLGLALAFAGALPQLAIPTLPSGVKPDQLILGEGVVGDSMGALFCMVLCVIAALSILMSDRYLEEKGINQGEFYALVLFSTAGAMVMALAYDLVNVFVGLEVLSVALYILAGFARRELRSEEAAVKYFLLGAFASGFLLFGTALVYGSVGIAVNSQGLFLDSPNASFTNFYVINDVLRQSAQHGTSLAAMPMFIAGVALVIVGLGFKAAIVPFHSYAPDVYEGAPTPVTAFMSAGAKAGAFAALIRLFTAILPAETADHATFGYVLWGLAAATMIVGNVLAVRQTNIKRMLAYSSVAHAGYILVGVLASAAPRGGAALVGAAAPLAQGAVLYYLFAYTFMNLGAFAVVVWLTRRDGREYLDIRDLAGLARSHPGAAAAMTIFLLSLSGIPPAAGFFGKLYVFLAAVYAGYPGLAVLGVLCSVIGVYYYLNIVVTMYFRQPEHEFGPALAGTAKSAAVIAAAATLVLGVIPTGAFSPRFGGSAELGARPVRTGGRPGAGGLLPQRAPEDLPRRAPGGGPAMPGP
jgi:NADH-quinone oxidoreductase subunit N